MLLNRKLNERANTQLLVHKENKKSEINRAVVLDLCKNDFKFFANNFIWIQNPRSEVPEEKDIPFLLWDYQEKSADEIIKAVEKGYDIPIEKSRDMGLSWLLIAILVWGWHFRQWECLVGSQKAENVDTKGNIKSLLEKARFIIDKLPDWMMPKMEKGYHDKYMVLVHPKHKATIAGESNNTNFGRSDRRKVIVFDEFTSWELTDKAAWQSCSATTKCRIPLSTPNTRGINCYFYEIIQDFKKKGKPYLRLHWMLHPIFGEDLYYDENGKPRSPWYDEEVRRATSIQEVHQELDIDYEASMSGKVFGEFKYDTNVKEVEYNPQLPLFVAWDFGLDQTAMLWIQPEWGEQGLTFNIIDEYANDGTGDGDTIYHYLDILDSKPYKKALHYGDPHSGNNKSLTSGQSPATILRRQGIIFRSQRTRIVNRVQAGRNILSQVRVNPKCVLTIEMFSSWQMRRPKSGQGNSQVPDHSPYSHIGEAYTYFAFNYRESYKQKEDENRSKSKKYDSISGVML